MLQGERPKADDNISLGSFRLEGIKKAKKGNPDIEICFEIDVNGIVHVSAEDLSTKSRYTLKLDHALDISDAKVSDIITDASASELNDLCYKNP